jgi:hypothetical protein
MRRRNLLVPLLAAAILLAVTAVAQAKTIAVTTTADPAGAGDCLTTDTSCSLRQAITAENGTSSGGDTIALGSSTYTLTQGTQLLITQPLTLIGNGVSATTIDGSQNFGSNMFQNRARILRVDAPATVTIRGLTFAGGLDEEDENCPSSPCSTINENGGGGLFNNGGAVTLDNVGFTNNAGSGNPLGGGVSNGSGSLTMTNVAFTGDAAGAGGALFVRAGTVTGTGITFESDSTTCCEGGAAYLLSGSVSLTNATVASSGGFNGGGAIANAGAALALDNVTLSDNGADIQTDTGAASTTIENTILGTDQSGGVACVAPGRSDSLTGSHTGNAITHDGGNNLDQGSSCNLTGSGDQSNADPLLAAIADNGGPTRTEALQAGSPAIGAANEANCPTTDQRGVARKNPCDIGAYEVPASPGPGPGPGPGPSGPSAQPAPPTVSGGAPTTRTSNGASVSGTVNPHGTPTQAYFQYGLDLGQRGPGADTTLYDQQTAAQPVGSDTTDHTVTGSLGSLIPGALYHVRLVATSSAGTTFGPDQTFTTAPAAPPKPPVLGQSEDVKPVSGTIFIKLKNGQFVPLTGATQIRSGTIIDALHGSLQLVAALGKGKTEHGIFGGAIFKITQAHNGLVNLSLVEAAFNGAPSYAVCHAHKTTDATAASSRTLQLLHASAHGKFRTTGRYSAATVRGTAWTIADRCDGTLVHDITHSVAVTDFVRHKTIVLHAGQSYLAKP